MSSLATQLQNTELFSVFSLDELSAVAERLTVREVAAGEVLYHMDDPADTLYVVFAGLVKVVKLFPNGKEALLTIVRPEGVLGEVLHGGAGFSTQAEALGKTSVVVIPANVLSDLCCDHPKLTLRLLRIMASQVLQMQGWAAELTAYNAPERVASLLLHLSEQFGDSHEGGTEIGVKLNQEDLARMVGATRETVSHSLRRLRDLGAIERQRFPMVVHPEGLKRFLEHSERPQ